MIKEVWDEKNGARKFNYYYYAVFILRTGKKSKIDITINI